MSLDERRSGGKVQPVVLGMVLVAAVAGMGVWMITGMEAPPPPRPAAPPPRPAPPPAPPALDPQQVARGEALYAQYCAACHGANLEGQPDWRQRRPDGRLPAPPHDETGHTWHHPDQVLFNLTKFGLAPPYGPEGYESDMPAFGEVLTDEQIRDILTFIKSTWPEELQIQQARRSGR